MKILSIETSCDETAVSLIEATGDFPNAEYKILGNALFSQIDIHREYGGVFPAVAKREHAKTLVPMLEKALKEAGDLQDGGEAAVLDLIQIVLEREPGLYEQLAEFAKRYKKPDIDLITVTAGPGLEPTLWVGVNFAKALSLLWNIPVVPVNHMEGHVLASIFQKEKGEEGVGQKGKESEGIHSNGYLAKLEFPALALLISGGHTEIILMKEWKSYEKIGQTRDDAVGEAFDKVARLLGLPYPGGPEISRLASEARSANLPEFHKLPRPMLDSNDLDFSFSGLKTAVRYAVADKDLTANEIKSVARDFEDAVTTVLLKKTESAVNRYDVKSIILGGGVSANSHIRDTFKTFFNTEYPEVSVYLPNPTLSTDNSVMIALAGHANAQKAIPPKLERLETIKANGNRSLADET